MLGIRTLPGRLLVSSMRTLPTYYSHERVTKKEEQGKPQSGIRSLQPTPPRLWEVKVSTVCPRSQSPSLLPDFAALVQISLALPACQGKDRQESWTVDRARGGKEEERKGKGRGDRSSSRSFA